MLSDLDNYAEFAVVVSDEWQGKGIASLLLKNLTEYAISVGIKQVKGFIFRNNSNMYALAKELGLKIEITHKTLNYIKFLVIFTYKSFN